MGSPHSYGDHLHDSDCSHVSARPPVSLESYVVRRTEKLTGPALRVLAERPEIVIVQNGWQNEPSGRHNRLRCYDHGRVRTRPEIAARPIRGGGGSRSQRGPS